VKPKFAGGFVVVGLFVPLSMHCPAPEQNPCSVSAFAAGTSTAATRATATTAISLSLVICNGPLAAETQR
jgi:hypothetical protein